MQEVYRPQCAIFMKHNMADNTKSLRETPLVSKVQHVIWKYAVIQYNAISKYLKLQNRLIYSQNKQTKCHTQYRHSLIN